MIHSEVEELLAAYALDAVDTTEAASVEAHLADCPRCSAEVARHRDVAGMFSSSPEEPPAELWNRISQALNEPDPAYDDATPRQPIAPITSITKARARRAWGFGAGLGLVAVAAAVLALVLGIQVSHLNDKVSRMQTALGSRGLSSAVATALVNPHRDVVLSSASGKKTARVVLTPSGEDYWVSSSLPRLASDRTYQLWALVGGKPVSIGLIGNDPSGYAAFRLGATASALMVTDEPASGTTAPTTRVVVQRTLTA